MKKFFNKHGFGLAIIGLFAVGAFLRLYNFPDRLIFGPEQAISLLTSAGNLQKFSLLGEPNLIRLTSSGHTLFSGALFDYLLLPFILLFNYRILPISLIFVALNLLTGLIFFQLTKKLFGKTIAILALFYFLTSAIMTNHSLFIWILNPLPLLGVLTIGLFANLVKNKNQLVFPLLLGLLSGIGFNLQYLYLPFSLLLLLLVIRLSPKRLVASSIYLFGFFLGNFTRVIFDLKHDFYHLRTMWQFFLDAYVYHSVSGSVSYYNFLYLYPLFFLFLAFITLLLAEIHKPFALLPLLLFLYFNFSSPLFNLYRSTGMAPGMTLAKLEQAAAAIAADSPPEKFNVATLWDFDTRAHPLRYLLRYYYKYEPQNYENYADIAALYVFAPANYDIKDPEVWELKTFLPYQVKELPSSASGYRLYKLTK